MNIATQSSASPILAAPSQVAFARESPSAISADLLVGAPWLLRGFAVLIALSFAAFVTWAALTSLDEITVGQGRVIPAKKIQVVQNLEGGIVEAIAIEEGAIVEKGALLVRINATGFDSNLKETGEKVLGLELRRSRLLAEIHGGEPEFGVKNSAARPDLIASEHAQLVAKRLSLASKLAALDQRISQRDQEIRENDAKITSLAEGLALAEEEQALTAAMVTQGVAPRVELIRLNSRLSELRGGLEAAQLAAPRLVAALAEARSERAQEDASARAETLKDLGLIETELGALRQSMQGSADKVARTEVRSPARGIVKQLSVTTIGQVVKPGADIVEIVPLDDTLLIEAKITPRDIAFVRPGQEAVVKISAYDYAIYGTLGGTLERIGADAIVTEKGESYYLVKVRTDRAFLEKDGHKLPIIPGMIAEVDLLTGNRTIMQYLLKPMTRMRYEALRER
jgi:membrane fusion protein, adhesin transport system